MFSAWLFALAACVCAAPSFPIAELNVTVHNGTLHFPVRIWYPEQGGANRTAFPVIAFAHCLFGGDGWYGYIMDVLVPSGYIVASTGFRDFLPAEAKHMAETQLSMYYAVVAMGTDPASPLFSIVGKKASLMGHSLGGSSTLLLAEAPTNFVSALPLNGCLMIEGIKEIKIPTMLVTGTSDCICNPHSNADPIYRMISGPCKILADIVNATHCNFAEFHVIPHVVESMCELAEVFDGDLDGCTKRVEYSHHIPAKKQFDLVVRYALPFFDWTLKGDVQARADLDKVLGQDNAAGITKVNSTAACWARTEGESANAFESLL